MQHTAVFAEPDTGPLFVTAEQLSQEDEALRRAREAERVKKQLIEVADYFTLVDPEGIVDDGDRWQVAVMTAGTLGSMRPLLRALPFASSLPKGSSRREYANLVRASAGDGDMPPSPIHIPRIPPQPQRPDNRTAVAA